MRREIYQRSAQSINLLTHLCFASLLQVVRIDGNSGIDNDLNRTGNRSIRDQSRVNRRVVAYHVCNGLRIACQDRGLQMRNRTAVVLHNTFSDSTNQLARSQTSCHCSRDRCVFISSK